MSSSISQTTTQHEPLLPPPYRRHQQQQQQPQHDHRVSFGIMQSSSPSSTFSVPGNYLSKDSGAYDLGDLDQALFLYLDGQQDPSSVQHQRREPSPSLIRTSN